MNFKRNFLALSYSLIAFNTAVCAMDPRINVQRLDLRSHEICKDPTQASKNLAQKALASAGINETITNESTKSGSFGTVFFSPNHAVKISQEYAFGINNPESTRIMNVTNKLKPNPAAGINFCLPTHIFQVYIDGSNKQMDGLQLVNGHLEAKYQGHNVQIMNRLRPQSALEDVWNNAVRYQTAKDLNTIYSFGEKVGEFQNWGLVIMPSQFTPDKTCLHHDMNPNNVLVMKTDHQGSNATFSFVDNADYKDAKSGQGGSLVSDITYLTYFATERAQNAFNGNWENGLDKTLTNFYIGYVGKLPQSVTKKLMETLYRNSFNSNDCYDQTVKDINYGMHNFVGSNKIPAIQSKTFALAYTTKYPVSPVHQPKPVFVPQPVQQPKPVFAPQPVQQPKPANNVPADFNGLFYVNLYHDLTLDTNHMDPHGKNLYGINHYKGWGCNEKRPYLIPVDFNGLIYVYMHSDLTKDVINQNPEQKQQYGYNHYVGYGHREGRQYKPGSDYRPGLKYIRK